MAKINLRISKKQEEKINQKAAFFLEKHQEAAKNINSTSQVINYLIIDSDIEKIINSFNEKDKKKDRFFLISEKAKEKLDKVKKSILEKKDLKVGYLDIIEKILELNFKKD